MNKITKKYTIRYTVLGALFGFMFPIFSTILEIYIQNLALTIDNIRLVQSQSVLLLVIDSAPFFLGLFASFAGRRQDQVEALNIELNQEIERKNIIISELNHLQQSLERRVASRTSDLEQQTTHLEASADVGQKVTSILEPEELVQEVVTLIKERFDLYYVGLFIVNETREYIVLQAGTGEAARVMLEKGHRLRIGAGMIGWCVANSRPRIAHDVGEDAVRFANPDLPETRSEAAIPMRSRGEVIGALSVQSRKPAVFNEDMIKVLQTMADQVAIAIDNARLFAESKQALESEKRGYSELTREAWQELLRSRTEISVKSSHISDVQAVSKPMSSEMEAALRKGIIVNTGNKTIVVPIILRDHVLGAVRLKKNDGGPNWTDREIALIKTLVDQLETALEGARLYEDSQQRAARERLVTEISTKIRENSDPEDMLETAVLELRKALNVQRAQVVIQAKNEEIETQ